MKPEPITYHYRGLIERGARYEWREGYSPSTTEGLVIYPWVTKAEAQAEAKRNGQSAVFNLGA